jgi:hypothetical protein
MSVEYYNELTVHGSRKNLDIFKIDMAGNWENGPLSFHNIMQEPKNVSKLEDKYQLEWRGLNWGCLWDAYGTTMYDELEKFVYTFITRNSAPGGIYDKLIEKYSELDFDIYITNDFNSSISELAYRKGKLTQNYYFYWKYVSLKDGKSKDILYREDLINNNSNIVEEHIFYGGEYDEGSHRWHTKDVKFSEVDGVAIYESMSR